MGAAADRNGRDARSGRRAGERFQAGDGTLAAQARYQAFSYQVADHRQGRGSQGRQEVVQERGNVKK